MLSLAGRHALSQRVTGRDKWMVDFVRGVLMFMSRRGCYRQPSFASANEEFL